MEKKGVRFIFLWAPVVIWCLLIFAGSSLRPVSTGQEYWSDFIIKKTFHLFEYFVLYLLSWRALKNYFPKFPFFVAFLFIAVYAASDEFHQSLVPGREPRLRDVIIDATGGVIAIWFLKNLQPKMPAKLKEWLKI